MLAMKKVIGDAPSFVPRCDDLNEYLVKLCGVALARDIERPYSIAGVRKRLGLLMLRGYAPREAAALESATNALIHAVGARGRYPKLVASHAGQHVQH
ncbi:MAG: hypothetical protein EPN77_19690 [Candidimonas sp.]|nr:MAG: hypothetical protein EPN77_19690 [Candidimonas sp.]